LTLRQLQAVDRPQRSIVRSKRSRCRRRCATSPRSHSGRH